MSTLLRELHQRQVAYFPIYADLLGKSTPAILLSQIMFHFSSLGKNKVFKTDADLMDETRMTPGEMRGAKRYLKKLSFLKITREGIPQKTFYEIDWIEYEKVINSVICQKRQINNNGDGGNTPKESIKKPTEKPTIIRRRTIPKKITQQKKSIKSSLCQKRQSCDSKKCETITYSTTYTLSKDNNGDGTPCSGIDFEKYKKRNENLASQNNTQNEKQVSEETIELLNYWNSFNCFTKHRIERHKRTIAPYSKQSKLVKKFDKVVKKLLAGEFFIEHSAFITEKALLHRKFTVDSIKKAIKVYASTFTPEFENNTDYKPGITTFVFNPRATLIKDNKKERYKYKYPIIYYTIHTPAKAENTRVRKKSNYPILVDNVIKKLSQKALTDKEYNTVVTQVDKAITLIESKFRNGQRLEMRRLLPGLIYDSLSKVNKGFTVDVLPLGVYNLERLLRERGYIR